MNLLGFGFEIGLQLVLHLQPLVHILFRAVVNFVKCRNQVWHDESLRIFWAQIIAPFFREVGVVALLINRVKELFLFGVELFFRLIRVHLQLGFVHEPHVFGILQQPHQRFRPRIADFHAIKQQPDFFLKRIGSLGVGPISGPKFFDQPLGLREKSAAKPFLCVHQTLNRWLELVIKIIIDVNNRWSANNQRRARFIDQNRVHFIDDGIIMSPLDLLFRANRHAVIAQIIESKLGVGPVGNIAVVLLATHFRRLIMQNAAHR